MSLDGKSELKSFLWSWTFGGAELHTRSYSPFVALLFKVEIRWTMTTAPFKRVVENIYRTYRWALLPWVTREKAGRFYRHVPWHCIGRGRVRDKLVTLFLLWALLLQFNSGIRLKLYHLAPRSIRPGFKLDCKELKCPGNRLQDEGGNKTPHTRWTMHSCTLNRYSILLFSPSVPFFSCLQ